ncbi:hypothetical protein HDZ31DRAFT_61548 [Schizophyllum fasciatum]
MPHTDFSSPDYAELPRYSTANLLPSAPPYPGVTHARHTSTTFPVEVKDGQVMLSIAAPRLSSKGHPKYLTGEFIEGQLSLDLEQAEHVHSVSITVKGRIVSTHSEIASFTFLKVRHNLHKAAQCHQKLVGKHQWPFAFPFPTDMHVEGKGKYRLPHAFSERKTAVAVHYELVGIVNHGKLRTGRKVRTQLAYVPRTVAGTPSSARLSACALGLPPPGPREDRHGWCTLEPAVVRGRIFEQRDVEARFILSLAQPLSFARGSAIPCCMTVQCFDKQALELLSQPENITVHLRRQVRYVLGDVRKDAAPRPVIVCDVAKATWWPAEGQNTQEYERRVDGEIHLAQELQPSSDFPYFCVQYSVVVIPAPPAGFKVQHKLPQIVQAVDITTWHPPGTTPRRTTARAASPGPVDQRYIETGDATSTLIDSLMAVFSSSRRRSNVT